MLSNLKSSQYTVVRITLNPRKSVGSAEAVPKLIAHNHMVWLYAFYPHALYLFADSVKFVHKPLLMAKEKGLQADCSAHSPYIGFAFSL